LVLGIPTKNLMTGNWCFQANVPPGDVRVPTERGNGPPHKLSSVRTVTWRAFWWKRISRKPNYWTMPITSPAAPVLPWLAAVAGSKNFVAMGSQQYACMLGLSRG